MAAPVKSDLTISGDTVTFTVVATAKTWGGVVDLEATPRKDGALGSPSGPASTKVSLSMGETHTTSYTLDCGDGVDGYLIQACTTSNTFSKICYHTAHACPRHEELKPGDGKLYHDDPDLRPDDTKVDG